MNADGTEHETLNHVGRPEFHNYFDRNRGDDPNLEEFILSVASETANDNEILNFFQLEEDPTQAGRYFAVDGPEFELFVRLMREHTNFWSKVTCPERLSASGPPDYADVVPFARRVVEEFPDRVLWGTDWPHPNMKTHMPDDGRLVDFIPRIAATAELQRKLLVDNPMRLYWPEEVA